MMLERRLRFPGLRSRAENLAQYPIEVIELSSAVSCETGAVHDGECCGVQVGELFQVPRGDWCVGDVLCENARLILLQRLLRGAHDISRRLNCKLLR